MDTNTFTDKREAAKAAVVEMHSQIAKRVESDADWRAYLNFSTRFHRYSPNNVMWMWAQWEDRKDIRAICRAIEVGFFGAPLSPPLPEMSHVAGASAWKAMGGRINKGEKALSVLAPFTIVDREADPDPVTGKQPTKVIGFVLKNRTFDLSQINGVETPESPVKLLEGAGNEALWDALVKLATHIGYTVEVLMVPGKANGRCIYGAKRIEVEVNRDRAQHVKTLAHEIAHALMHDPAVQPPSLSQEIIEVEAESVAYTVLNLAGVDSSDYSFGYVAGWAGGNGPLIAATLERVSLTAARISTFIEEGKLPEARVVKFYKVDPANAEVVA